ncbi:MAG TPA: UbiA family prenyltransferase, partial [Chitinophagales bacterium]|nr:UbiA family prenyltransferase [Chitinophagales bacterium]
MKKYLSLVKFSHTIFALPFALIGFFLGMYAVTTSELLYANFIGIQKFVIFFKLHGTLFLFVLLCMVTARNAAMAFNRYIDRKFDEQNPRTAIREIPSGIIT